MYIVRCIAFRSYRFLIGFTSSLGLGAVLYQPDTDGKQHVISYASRGLKKSERNYPAHKLEFLALKWSITTKFHDYLYGNTLQYLLTITLLLMC